MKYRSLIVYSLVLFSIVAISISGAFQDEEASDSEHQMIIEKLDELIEKVDNFSNASTNQLKGILEALDTSIGSGLGNDESDGSVADPLVALVNKVDEMKNSIEESTEIIKKNNDTIEENNSKIVTLTWTVGATVVVAVVAILNVVMGIVK